MTPRRVMRPASSLRRRVEAVLTAGPPQPSRGIRCAVLSGCASSEAVCPNGGPLVVPLTLIGNAEARTGRRMGSRSPGRCGSIEGLQPGCTATRLLGLDRSRDSNPVARTGPSSGPGPALGREGKTVPTADTVRKARPRTESQASSGPQGSGRLSRLGRERTGRACHLLPAQPLPNRRYGRGRTGRAGR